MPNRTNIFDSKSGIYGSPVAPNNLNGIKLPQNPEVSTPETSNRKGIQDVTPGANNDILPSPVI